MSNLQKRLAETERALFYALRELHDGAIVQGDYDSQTPAQPMPAFATSNDAPTTRQQKARQEMRWRHTPLGSRAQAKAWLDSMRGGSDGVDGGDHHHVPAKLPPGAGELPVEASGDGVVFPIQQGSDSVPKSHVPQRDGAVQPRSFNGSRRKRKRTLGDVDGPRPIEASSGEETSATHHPSSDAQQPSKASIFANANRNIYF